MSYHRIFITGVAGFLGSHLAEWALSQGYKVIGADNLSLGSKNNIPKEVEFYEYDVLDLEKNKKYLDGVDVVFHAVAYPYDNFSLSAPFKVSQNTFSTTASVLTAAISNSVRRFVYCSSMSRYGDNKSPFVEDMSSQPLTPYGVAKAAGEKLVKNLSQVYGFEYVICIPHNVFGPRQICYDPYRNAVSLIINQMLANRSPIIYGDGEQRRNFSPIQDLIPLFRGLLFGETAKNQIINIGPDEESISLNELIQILNDLMGKNITPIYKPFRPQEVKSALCSSDKARKILNYKKVISLRTALEELIAEIQTKKVSAISYTQTPEIDPAIFIKQRKKKIL